MNRPFFVARERELRRLDAFLDRALSSQGQICFVSGEAGSGKTALLTEFARRAEAHHLLEQLVPVGPPLRVHLLQPTLTLLGQAASFSTVS